MTDSVYRRPWSKAEESLLLDVWESNSSRSELASFKEMQIRIHQELSLHLNIPVKDVINKTNAMRRQYRNALTKPHLQDQWIPFSRLHSFLKGLKSTKNHDKQNGQNENSTDESVFTVDDSHEYIGCEPDDIYVDIDINNDHYQIDEPQLESKNEVIELDDDDDDAAATDEASETTVIVQDADCTNSNEMNAIQATEYEQNFTTGTFSLLPANATQTPTNATFLPIQVAQPVQTPTADNFSSSVNQFTNFPTDFENSLVAQKIYVCQPVQQQPIQPQTTTSIPIATAQPNCDSTSFNSTQTIRTKTAEIAPAQHKKRKQKSIRSKEQAAVANSYEVLRSQLNNPSMQSNEPNASKSLSADPTSIEMLKTLTSLDESLKSFVRVQENLTRQIYREGLQHTVLLTRILEEEQRKTMLMEELVKLNKLK